MATPRHLTQSRLAEILRRQDPPKFGPDYEPAIKPTREEAPPNCRPAAVWSAKLGRDVSTLSDPERAVLAIVLYCNWLFELQEQRMLPFLPSPHPLHGHPLATGLDLKPFRGTLTVADELHHLKWHPSISVKQEDGGVDEVPACLIGDFLLFLSDAMGPFCVNLNVKATRQEFEVPQVGVTVKTDVTKASVKEVARHEIERKLYADIDIPTVEVAADELPEILVLNLQQLLLWQRRKAPLTAAQIALVIDAFNDGLELGASALEVMSATELSHQIRPYDQKIVLYQAIFSRRLRLDLFDSHFFIDKPMRPESQDVLAMFGHWFQRRQ